jgi:hypothetical protein
MLYRLLTFCSFVALSFSANGQYLIENNNHVAKKWLGVKKETGYYQFKADSACLMWIKEFDENGMLTKYIDHWQCGELYCIYENTYNRKGQMVGSGIGYYTNNFKMTKVEFKYDNEGRIIENKQSEEIPRFPDKTTFEYDERGRVTKMQQWRYNGKDYDLDYERNWNGDTSYPLTKFDSVYQDNGKLKWVVLREFEFH